MRPTQVAPDGTTVPDDETLRLYARTFCNASGQADVERWLSVGESHAAQSFIHGAVYALWTARAISDEEAKDAYEALLITKEMIVRLERSPLQ